MPSIEIVCIGQEKPTDFSNLPFAVVSGRDLVSHRSPTPLFQREFDELSGCMYHLGNPACRDQEYTGPFFAYDLIQDEDDSVECLRFSAAYVDSVRLLLAWLLDASPVGREFFTTDWQCGPDRVTRGGVVRHSDFWRMHDEGHLRWNGSYTINLDSA